MSIDLLLTRRAAVSTRRRKPTATVRRDRAAAEMPDWLDKARALPDIRWDKVARIREALHGDRYNMEARLHDLLADLPDEFVALRDASS
jgi:hypothetical protein